MSGHKFNGLTCIIFFLPYLIYYNSLPHFFVLFNGCIFHFFFPNSNLVKYYDMTYNISLMLYYTFIIQFKHLYFLFLVLFALYFCIINSLFIHSFILHSFFVQLPLSLSGLIIIQNLNCTYLYNTLLYCN